MGQSLFDLTDQTTRLFVAWAIYSVVGTGWLLILIGFTGVAPVWTAIPFGVLGGTAGWWFLYASGRTMDTLAAGTTGVARAVPLLGKARTLIQRGDWEGAKVELESQWSAFPGHLDVVREFERLYLDGFQAPAAAGTWLAGSLAAVKGPDRAYVYLRLAEVYADSDARDHAKAVSWCKRLLAEFPAAHEAPTARAILDQLSSKE